MKKIVLTLIFSFSLISGSFSQNIDIKDGIVLSDKVPILNCKVKKFENSTSISKLDTKKEIIFMVYFHQTSVFNESYMKIMFIDQGKELTIRKLYTNKYLINWFIENDLFDPDWNINLEKLELFIKKYDEKIIE